MKNTKIIATLVLILLSFLSLVACENTNLNLEESELPIEKVEEEKEEETVVAQEYELVSKEEVISYIEYFQNNEENLIDWNSGLSVYALEKRGNIEKTLNCKFISSILNTEYGVGEWTLKANDGNRTETTKLIYDGNILYKEEIFVGNTQKMKGQCTYREIINYTDVEDFEDIYGEILYLATESDVDVKYYLNKSNENLIKLKIQEIMDESEYVGIFVFDNNYNVKSINIEMLITEQNQSQKIVLNIEKWSGSIVAPSNTSEYNEVDNILD